MEEEIRLFNANEIVALEMSKKFNKLYDATENSQILLRQGVCGGYKLGLRLR